MTTTIFLVRHAAHDRLGRTLCGRMAGVGLSESGVRQASVLAERMRSEAIAALYTSPLERARQTAGAIAGTLALPVREDADLDEIDFGGWTGRTFEDLAGDPEWVLWNRARSLAQPPGGEAMAAMQARVARWVWRARGRHPGERIAAVSHGDVIKALLAQVLGFPIDHHERLDITPASVSAVVVGDWGAKVLSVGEPLR